MSDKPDSIDFKGSKDDFVQWLKSLPPDTTFCEVWRVKSCPLAKFTGHETWTLKMPAWAERFMHEFDIGQHEGDTLERALKIAELL